MSKQKENAIRFSNNENGKIKNIANTVNSGARMSKSQLRFSLTVVGVLLVALVLLLIVAGGKAGNANQTNEKAAVLQDAVNAERIVPGDGNVISFVDGYSYKGEGPRYILTKQMTTTKNYWATVKSDSEIAEMEGILGEGRFLKVENLGDRSLWLVLATEADVKKCGDGFAQLYTKDDLSWLKTGTDEENKAAEEAWNRIRFIRFEELGETKIRLRRGSEETLKNLDSTKSTYRVLKVVAIVVLAVLIMLFGHMIKPRKGLEDVEDNRKSTRSILLIAIAVFLVAVIFLSFQQDKADDEIARMDAMIIEVDRNLVAEAESDVQMIKEAAGKAEEALAAAETKAAEATSESAKEKAEEALATAKENAENARAAVQKAEQAVEDARKEMEARAAAASGQKYTFINNQGNESVVSVPKAGSAMMVYRILKYVIIALVFGLLLWAMFWFRNEQDLGFPIFNTILLTVLMFITLYPVINTVAYSFNEGTDALRGGIGLWPRVFSTKSYTTLLTKEVGQAALISASKTIITTILNLLLTGMLAFALSRKEYVLRKFITTILVLTMYVNAGLIPNYLLISRELGLKNTFWVYIIPTMFSCFNMIVIRTYIAGLPDALVESAHIDGAGDFRAYWQIIFPLCTPVLATVALFVAVGAWNSWFDTYLYCGTEKDLYTLQYILKMKLATTQNSANAAQTSVDALKSTTLTTPVTIRCAITVISTVPILIVYPFLQKYFVTGMALGAVKG